MNFDPEMYPEIIGVLAEMSGDHEEKTPFRRFARFWLEPDYAQSLAETRANKEKKKKSLNSQIDDQYADQTLRDDIESSEIMTSEVALPRHGMQIHNEYTMYGHYRFLKNLLPGAKHINFFMEQESGIRAACLSAFAEEISADKVEAFFISINKDLTIHEKDRLQAQGKREILAFIDSMGAAGEQVSFEGARQLIIEQRIKANEFVVRPPFNDKWLIYPHPPRNEAEKQVSYQSDTGQKRYTEFQRACLYSKATLHGIDRFFQQVRRRVSLLERSISTSSSIGRKWYGYCPYNPVIIEKMLTILRVYYNFVKPGEDKQAPAMRLGLMSSVVKESRILYFMS